jgi:outer membrane protein OmpA-like peptidoglycan-associated protein
MRISRHFLSCLALVSLSPTASAQTAAPATAQGPTRTVDDYVCAFTGKCGETAPADNPLGTAVRGFRLSVPEHRESQPPTTASPRGGNSAIAQDQRTGRKRGARQVAAATQPRRVDLRVSFELGSAELTPQAREEVRVFAQALLVPDLAARRFRIEGHTDSSGSRAANIELSKRRAQAVADLVSSLGVQPARLEVRGYGPDRPLPGHAASSPDNRRVEARLL